MASDYDSSKMKKNLIFSKEENRYFKPDFSDIGIDNSSKNLNGNNSKNVLYQSNSKYLSESDQRIFPPTEKQKEPIFESKHSEVMNPKLNSGLKDTNFLNYQNDSFSIEENYVNNNQENNHQKGKTLLCRQKMVNFIETFFKRKTFGHDRRRFIP